MTRVTQLTRHNPYGPILGTPDIVVRYASPAGLRTTNYTHLGTVPNSPQRLLASYSNRHAQYPQRPRCVEAPWPCTAGNVLRRRTPARNRHSRRPVSLRLEQEIWPVAGVINRLRQRFHLSHIYLLGVGDRTSNKVRSNKTMSATDDHNFKVGR